MHTPSIRQLRQAAAQPKPRSLLRRALPWLAGLVLAWIVFGFFIAPPLIKSRAITELSSRLNREVAIERIQFNPLTLALTIEGLAITDPDGTPFLGWRRLFVNFDSFSFFTGEWRFQAIALEQLTGRIALAEDGTFNFADLLPTDSPAKPATPPTAESPLRPLRIAHLTLTEAAVDFSDASREQPFATTIGPVSFTLLDFHTGGDRDAPYEFTALTGHGETLDWRGTVSVNPLQSTGQIGLRGLRLDKYSPYYADLLTAQVRSGLLDFSSRYTLDLAGPQPAFSLEGGEIRLSSLNLHEPDRDRPFLSLKQVTVEGLRADLATRSASVRKVAFAGGQLTARRAADGSLDLATLLTPPITGTPAPASDASTPLTAGDQPPVTWPEVKVLALTVENFAFTFEDRSTPRRAWLEIPKLNLDLRDFALNDPGRALPFELSAAFPDSGALTLHGTLSWQPLTASLRVGLVGFPLPTFGPYLEPFFNTRLASGSLATEGTLDLSPDGAITYAGELSLDAFRTVDPLLSEDFIKWETLRLDGLLAASEPPALRIENLLWKGLDASLIIDPEGRTNLAAALTPPPSPSDPARLQAAASPNDTPPSPDPLIEINRITLEGVGLRFADRTFQPASRAALTNLRGTLSGLSSSALARADLDLRGEVDGVAPFTLVGQLNPLGSPAFADLKTTFERIDLQAAAGPYLRKYAGYELARGTLSLDIDFNLQDRQIVSDNRITLDQFFLGARTNSPDATRLPVSLAVALLRDGRGQIALAPGIRGSLDDPEFRISGVILRIFVNLIARAATSPFALLGSMFGGGGEELGYQLFPAGLAALDENEVAKLQTVARALRERPALNLDLIGGYDPVADLHHLRHAMLDLHLRTLAWERLRAVDPLTPPPGQLQLDETLRTELIREFYAAHFTVSPLAPATEGQPETLLPSVNGAAPAQEAAPATRRPSRHLGRLPRFSSSPAPTAPTRRSSEAPPTEVADTEDAPAIGPRLEEMRASLAASMPVPEDALAALANGRAETVRRWLMEQGEVPPGRIFLSPIRPSGRRVDLSLR